MRTGQHKKITCKKNISDYSSIIREIFDCVEDGDIIEFEKGIYPIGAEDAYKVKIGLSNNDYTERKIAVYLCGKKNITIKGNGAVLFFTDTVGAFGFENCENIVLNGFSVDYEKNYHLEFSIDKISGTKAELTKREGFDFEITDAAYAGENKIVSALCMEFDKNLNRPYVNRPFYFLNFGNEQMPRHYSAAKLAKKDDLICLQSEIVPRLHEGGVLLMCYRRMRDVQCCFFDRCKNAEVSDLEIYYSLSMGLVMQLTENISLKNIKVGLNGRHGMISSICDATHFVHCTGNLKISDCSFFNMMDDGVNIHGNYATVKSVSENTVFVQIRHKQQEGVNVYQIGDALRVYEGASVKIIAQPKVVGSELVALDTVKLILEGDLSEIKAGDVVCNYDRMPTVEIDGVSVGNNRPRGFLLNSSKKTVVRNCIFSDCEHGIELAGDSNYWFESGCCTDVTIENCVFDDCNYSAGDFAIMIRPVYTQTTEAPFYHGIVNILNNTFVGKTGMVYAEGVERLTIIGNKRRRSKLYDYPEKATDVKIKTKNCGFGQVCDNEDEEGLLRDLEPFWIGDRIYEECFTLVEKTDTPTFLYAPETTKEIVVTDYNKKTVFENGKDYKIKDGKFELCSDAIPYYEHDEFYRTEPDRINVRVDPEKLSFPDGKKRYFKFGGLHQKTLRISYRCDKSREGVFQPYTTSGCPAFLGKLKQGKKVKVLFYGDSITEGANASAEVKIAPFMDLWEVQACEFLRKIYKADNLEYVNTAVGGKDSRWGLENVKENVLNHSPDLVVLAFGMNDGGKTLSEFKALNEQMIFAIKEAKRETELILVGTSVPNPESTWYGNQSKFVECYEELAERYSCSVLDMTRLTIRLYGENGVIRYRDFTGNNVNHPNDFGVRIYAQCFLSRVLGKEYEDYYREQNNVISAKQL